MFQRGRQRQLVLPSCIYSLSSRSSAWSPCINNSGFFMSLFLIFLALRKIMIIIKLYIFREAIGPRSKRGGSGQLSLRKQGFFAGTTSKLKKLHAHVAMFSHANSLSAHVPPPPNSGSEASCSCIMEGLCVWKNDCMEGLFRVRVVVDVVVMAVQAHSELVEACRRKCFLRSTRLMRYNS